MNDNELMPFGKYKGKPMIEVPDEYLLWLYNNNKVFGNVLEYIMDNIEAIRANINYNRDDQE
ncbi:MAG: DUF3820 family protein [Candidatus Paceibacterota bacterium]|jgi:uncharacterized protein (DUF3820 family)